MAKKNLADKYVLKIAEMVRRKGTKQGRIPFDKGDLRKSVQVERLGRGVASVGSNLPYARAVHDGRKALMIYPNVKKNPPFGKRTHKNFKKARLKFKIKGKTIFAKSVFQKKRKGQPFLREAVDETKKEGFDFLMPSLKKDVGDELAKQFKKNIKIGF